MTSIVTKERLAAHRLRRKMGLTMCDLWFISEIREDISNVAVVIWVPYGNRGTRGPWVRISKGIDYESPAIYASIAIIPRVLEGKHNLKHFDDKDVKSLVWVQKHKDILLQCWNSDIGDPVDIYELLGVSR